MGRKVRGWAIATLDGVEIARHQYKLRAMVLAGLFDGPRDDGLFVLKRVMVERES
jgi:hypothetical protein